MSTEPLASDGQNDTSSQAKDRGVSAPTAYVRRAEDGDQPLPADLVFLDGWQPDALIPSSEEVSVFAKSF